jgi:outer membrane immunogenic protein
MKSLLLRSVALSALMVSSAVAADLPLKAPPAPVVAAPNWTGFYVGLNAGVDWAHSGDPATSASCTAAPGFFLPYFGCTSASAVNAVGTGSMSGSGFTGGGQIGYNWQMNSLVLGAEADMESFHGKAWRTGTGIYPGSTIPFSVTNSVSATWLFTARARVGWALSNDVLLYGTGGLALTDLSANNSFGDDAGFPGPGIGTWSASQTKVGWTAGAGAEWALTTNWSVKAEYLYVHFGAITANGIVQDSAGFGYGSAISTSTDLSAHIARAGINYRF